MKKYNQAYPDFSPLYECYGERQRTGKTYYQTCLDFSPLPPGAPLSAHGQTLMPRTPTAAVQTGLACCLKAKRFHGPIYHFVCVNMGPCIILSVITRPHLSFCQWPHQYRSIILSEGPSVQSIILSVGASVQVCHSVRGPISTGLTFCL